MVSAFGNHLGRFGWFEGREGGGFREHTLIERPGAIGSWVEDSDKDGIAEIWVLMAQAREGLVLFRRGPGGDFVEEPVAEFHPVFGVTSFQVRDFNSDGLPDVLITNGDNGEYPSPFKRYHGVRVLLNAGGGRFREGWFLAMNGAFKALAEDFDGDGDLDIAAISYFSDYATLSGGGFLMLENVGGLNFKASTMPEAGWGRWLTMDVGDLDEDGDVDVVLGSFVAGPMGVPVPPSVLEGWKRSRSAGLVLENRRR